VATRRDEAPALQVMAWPTFAEFFRREHRQGEHVSIVGPTGSGKSVLGLSLCKIIGDRPARDGRPARVVVFATKPRDRTVAALGWPSVKEWPPGYGQEHVVVWPRPRDPDTAARQQRVVFRKVMQAIYREGGQTVYIDEAAYFERQPPTGLGLGGLMEQYWQTARSLDLTLIAGTQRPRLVSRSMWSEPSWVFIFRVHDEDDLRRVAEAAGGRAHVVEAAQRLGGHEFLVVRRARGGERELYVSRVST
jgi:energy-coupling factor transporter ATP-binding protein EcfA2